MNFRCAGSINLRTAIMSLTANQAGLIQTGARLNMSSRG
jgi:hypothetical protein